MAKNIVEILSSLDSSIMLVFCELITFTKFELDDPVSVDVFAQHSQCWMQNVLQIFYH